MNSPLCMRMAESYQRAREVPRSDWFPGPFRLQVMANAGQKKGTGSAGLGPSGRRESAPFCPVKTPNGRARSAALADLLELGFRRAGDVGGGKVSAAHWVGFKTKGDGNR